VGALSVQPDASGLWPLRCTVPSDKPLQVSFDINGREAATSSVDDPAAASTVVEVRLRRERNLSILVLDQHAAPVVGATIKLLWPAALSRAGSGRGAGRALHVLGHSALLGGPAAVMEASTDREGRAVAPRLADGPLAWAVTAVDHFPATGFMQALPAESPSSAAGPDEPPFEITVALRAVEALASR
jgi:hypothetical protein